jgi:hypothetical protein
MSGKWTIFLVGVLVGWLVVPAVMGLVGKAKG